MSGAASVTDPGASCMLRGMQTTGPRSAQEALKSTPPFEALPGDEIQRLAPYARVRVHEKGDTIFMEGDDADRFYTVVSGRVKVVKFAPHGKELILEIIGPGDPFGAVAVYEGRPFPASAVALQTSEVLGISRRDFFTLLERHPEITRGLMLGLTRRLMDLTHKLAQLSSGGVEYRIASLFLTMADRMGDPSEGGTLIPMALSRQDIADMVGTTIESAIRVMSRWGRDGIVRTERSSFVIEDRDALERIVSEG